MKKLSVMAALVVAVAVLVVAMGQRTSVAVAADNKPIKLGLVNVIKILTECQENVQYRQGMMDRTQKIKADRDKLMQEADKLQQELENVLQPGTKEYTDQIQKWYDKRALVEAFEKGQKQAMGAESQAFMERLYKKLAEEVNRVARLEGYDLIMDVDTGDIKTRNINELEELINNRKVLYGSAMLDMTGRVIESLDKKFEADKAALGK